MHQNLKIEILSTKDEYETAEVLANIFSSGEPMSKHQQVSKDEFLNVSNYFCREATKLGLSLIGKLDNKIVAAIIVDTTTTPFKCPEDLISAKINANLAFLEKLTASYMPPGKIVHLNLIGVDPNFAGQRIASTLFKAQLQYLKDQGYEQFIIEATNPHTWKLVKKYASETKILNSVKFNELVLADGRKPFRDLEGEAIFALANTTFN